MNIPADLPSTDQENVYYSISALVPEFMKYFKPSSINILKTKLKEYYYPTFVFDDSNKPNSYQLDVYPREGSKEQILIDENGGIILADSIKAPSVNGADPLKLDRDKASGVTLDSTFYSTAKLKHSDFFVDLNPDQETITDIDLVLGSKFWWDENYAKDRLQFLSVSKSLVSNSLSAMPKEEMDKLEEKFEIISQQIEDTVQVLTDIKEGQAGSLDALNWENLLEKSYKQSSIGTSAVGLEGTKVAVGQSIYDLSIAGQTGSYPDQIRPGKITRNLNDSDKVITTSTTSLYPYHHLQIVWGGLINKLVDNNYLTNTDLEISLENFPSNPEDPFISELPESVKSVVGNFSFGGQSKPVFDSNGWLKNWYYSNFGKKIVGKDAEFSGLDEFISNFKVLSKDSKQIADKNILGGGFLLVQQAIFKSILKMTQSNMDVSEYTPKINDISIFDKMGRSSALGPSGCHQYPSKYSQPEEEEFQIESYSKPGFLCYHALLEIMRSCGNSSYSTKKWIKENLVEFDSDHDKTIDLWNDVQKMSPTWKQSHAYQINGDYTSKVGSGMNKLAHLYKINEIFSHREVYLVGIGDGRVPASERTFINYNIPFVDHAKETLLLDSSALPTSLNVANHITENNELLPLSDDFPNAFDDSGRLKASGHSAPNAYKLMGYKHNPNNSSVITYKRTERVHYGIQGKGQEGVSSSNNVFDFYKQKNWNLPYFWASIVSINKGLVIEAYRHLIESIQDITGQEMEISDSFITNNLNLTSMWNSIVATCEDLIEMNDYETMCFSGGNGTLTFTSKNVEDTFRTRIWRPDWRNTNGMFTGKMIKSYIKFASMCSSHKSVQIMENHEEVTFDAGTFVPPEILAVNTNLNFKNGHGGFSNYISDQFEIYYDPLVFKISELKESVAIKKNTTAVGIDSSFLAMYSKWLYITKVLWGHVSMHKNLVIALEEFKTFIDGFSIQGSVKEIFTEGHFDAEKDIQNPGQLINQIRNNIDIYAPNENKIGKYWSKINLNEVSKSVDEILYVYILGLKKSLWTEEDQDLIIYPEYWGTDGPVEISAAKRAFKFRQPKSVDSIKDELFSKSILDYFHLMRGIHCNELTFSAKTKAVFSDLIIDSESGIFPWEKDDFEEGEPKEPVDPLFFMSPVVFPRNYFYDVCLENEFQRVVGVAILKKDLENLPIEVIDPGSSLEDIIGSIRWVCEGN